MGADADMLSPGTAYRSPRRVRHSDRPRSEASGAGARRLGTVGGVELFVHPSWLLVAALITWSFWDRFDSEARFEGLPAFLMALGGAVLFFASVLAHELAHALEARHRGVPVSGITLFLFGGVTHTTLDARRPTDELTISAVGPFTSLAASAVLGLLATGADEIGVDEIAAVLGLVGWLNVGLALFNLLPGAPLDGGRIVRGLAWRLTGDRDRASRIAAHAGRVVGMLLVALGLLEVFFVPDGFVSGLWLALIGWFLLGVANAELADAVLRPALRRIPARRLVGLPVPPVPADASVQQAIDRWFRVFPDDAILVTDGNAPVGVLRLDDVLAVRPEERTRVRVREVLLPLDDLPHVEAGAPGSSLVDALGEGGVVVVPESDTPIGVVTQAALGSRLRRERELDGGPAGRR